MAFFLGIDGGQSSTVAIVADENGRVLGVGKGGPCNHAAAGKGRVKFIRAVTECLDAACLQAGLNPSDIAFEAACLGFSGGTGGKEAFTRETIRTKALKITHDAEIALTGATGGKPGLVVIAGTGSIAFGKNGTGRTFRAGGWGYIFGDEGGAFDIVRQALRAALAMEEGWGPSTALLQKLVEKEAMSANQLMHHWYNHFDRKKIAALAPLVSQVAIEGDEIARDIIDTAAAKLAGLARVTFGSLFRQNEPAIIISYVGGVFESSLLTRIFKQKVTQTTRCEPTAPIYPPAAGALLEAFRLTGRGLNISDLPGIKT